jgi:hypothetical protein
MRRGATLFLAGALFALPAHSGQKDAEIEALVDLSVAQHSALASCTILSKRDFDATMSYWERDRREAVMPMLVKLGVAPEVFVRLIQKTAPEKLTLKTKGTVGELAAYCAENRETIKKLFQLNGVYLPIELEKMLK